MSYRAFKRLLGETSLERKCRFLFGAGILLLITASFWWYAHQTEDLAYSQTRTTGRLLVNPILVKRHDKLLRGAAGPDGAPGQLTARQREQLAQAMDELSDETLPEGLRNYHWGVLKPNAKNREHKPDDGYEQRLLEDFLADEAKIEDSRPLPGQLAIHYYAAIRASQSCLTCHPLPAERESYGD